MPPRRLGAPLLAGLCALALPRPAHAEPTPSPLQHLGPNAARAFGPPGLFYHAAAALLTAGMAAGGLDHQARRAVQHGVDGSDAASSFSHAMIVGGYLIPALTAPGLYAAGLLAGRNEPARAGAAAIQALALTTGATFALKALTGRPFPLHGGDPRAPDRLDHPEYAREFGPPSLRNVSWPSGHTSAGFALASSLTFALPGRWWVPLASYPVAAALGAGMLVGDHHWASDVVAGALLGHAIGSAVGRGFAAPAGSLAPQQAWLLPLPRPGGGTLALVGAW